MTHFGQRLVRALILTLCVWTGLGLLLAIAVYSALSGNAQRPLSWPESQRFAQILVWAGLGHWAAPRAYGILADSLSDAAVTHTTLTLADQSYVLPLPPYTLRKSCDRLVAGLPKQWQTWQRQGTPGPQPPPSCLAGAVFPTEYAAFLTVASEAEFEQYVTETLPQAGWVYEDRYGAAWVFCNGEVSLTMIAGSYLTVLIDDFELMLQAVPTPR